MNGFTQHYFEMGGVGLLPSLYRVYYLMIYVLYVELLSSQTQFTMTLRRICIYLCLLCVLPALVVWNHVGLFLDDILFDDWVACKIDRPLFIVGNARSGTTWFHRLVTKMDNCNDGHDNKDSPRFTTFKTWEILFAVSITWKLLLHIVHSVDSRYLGGAMVYVLSRIEDRLVGNAHTRESYVHPIGLMNAEEDEWLMMHIGCAQLILFFFPLGSTLLHPLIVFDDGHNNSQAQLSVSTRRMVFSYYRDCVKRHLYFQRYYLTINSNDNKNKRDDKNGNDIARSTIFVSKNPAFTLRLGRHQLTHGPMSSPINLLLVYRHHAPNN